MIEFIHPNSVFKVSIEHAEKLLKAACLQQSYTYFEIKMVLPERDSFLKRFELKDLLIPWDSHFEGVRLSLFNGSQIRILDRLQGKVVSSKVIQNKDPDIFYQQLVSHLQSNIWAFVLFLKLDAETQRGYSDEEAVQFLKDSFLKEVKPFPLPKIEWPSETLIRDLVLKQFPNLCGRIPDPDGAFEFGRHEEKFIFKSFSEKGHLELQEEASFSNLIFSRLIRDHDPSATPAGRAFNPTW